MHVKPADPNAVIRDPHTKRPLPASGGRVPDNGFWRRRLRDGEVVLVTQTNEVGAKPAAPIDKLDEMKADAAFGPPAQPVAPLTTRDVKKKG